MQNVRVTVPLDDAEATALISMAEAECRHPREQMRFLLRMEAARRGILPVAETQYMQVAVEDKCCEVDQREEDSLG